MVKFCFRITCNAAENAECAPQLGIEREIDLTLGGTKCCRKVAENEICAPQMGIESEIDLTLGVHAEIFLQCRNCRK